MVGLCSRALPSCASFLRSVHLHTLQTPNSVKVTSLASSPLPPLNLKPRLENQHQSPAITTLSCQAASPPLLIGCTAANSFLLRPLLPELSSSLEHYHLLLHLISTFSVSLNQTCQQSFQPLALSPHVNDV